MSQKKIAYKYLDVVLDKANLDKMLVYSKGERKVPVIVEKDTVTIGHNGMG